MTVHRLKIHSVPLSELISGKKTSEVRDCSDRDFKVGDEVVLTCGHADMQNWQIHRTISHIQTGYGLPDGLCVLSYAYPLHAWAVAVRDKVLKPRKDSDQLCLALYNSAIGLEE